MAIYALSDFHLYLGIKDKPMDVFGSHWDNHMERIETNCRRLLTQEDTLLIPGDISWATYLEQALEDLQFIHRLPGKKIISKGNHDYWWTTAKKLMEFRDLHELDSISFLHNNFYDCQGWAICGNRGWIDEASDGFTESDRIIFERELQRLELSLKEAHTAGYTKKIVMTHYPPGFGAAGPNLRILELLKTYGVQWCLYGHLHGVRPEFCLRGRHDGVEFRFVSCDCVEFMPLLIER